MNGAPSRSDKTWLIKRAVRSYPPPAGAGTIRRTGRDGYACAHATRDTDGSAATPAVRCRNFRRGSFILNLPSHHSITSSVRAHSVGRISRAERLGSFEVDQSLSAH